MANKVKKLYRSESEKMIAGVAGGLGEYFEVDPTIVRIIFLILVAFYGLGAFIYVAMWLIVPTESDLKGTSAEVMNKNVGEIKEQVKKAGEFVKAKVEEKKEEEK